MDDERIAAYLRRLGLPRPRKADAETLRELQLRHLRTVPFENLSVHLGEDVQLTEEAVVEKVTARARGGFCYELNGAFAALLRALGFEVTLLNARVTQPDGAVGPPYDHLTLAVRGADGSGPWLADVGFGDNAHHPLLLDSRAGQRDPAGLYRLTETAEGDLDLTRDGIPQFRIETRPRAFSDFEATCWFHRTSPLSPFTRSLVCSRFTEHGRITLSGRRLTVTAAGGRETTELPDEAAVLDAYRTHFGISLEREPTARDFGPRP
ncbi:arylamine N-acetyltransferase [Streptomyces sp. DSM 44917]|uniref:Arylamine N-acetyltransferase n=1 Tax=Streptomyces boetiae TaxID=3075541 RepID=A0ABU2L7D7_9ACTN|nr:arylamine N-acetyltransferase [Streptomyces sp. DSM 44917]MDT0307484.1 arylamine N-acetyltransferase [Streptomyces sp. DSM 44917]